ncbi:MAG: GHKL domain-containing protein [Saprospiraceae bacterium]|jgi:Na+/proline symporter/nitrogen-specific signal transduction histidine kinase|nr:GHKL domain-containing protein [Saprospiraceae bacterium]
MGLSLIVGCSLAYISLLFVIAWWVDKHADQGKSLVSSPYVYALSLAVYCTAWTFFGSVGRATTGGLSFLGVYLGPSLLAPLWYMLLRKMILISKNQRITSIADFISARYGKNATIAVLVTLIAVLGIVPYISIQLKAVAFGINTLTHFGESPPPPPVHFWLDAGFWITIAMALFTAVFGTRKLDPNERHEGLVAAIAFESIVKLLAFLAVGIFVTFVIYGGFGDLFSKAIANPDTARLLSFEGTGTTPFTWNILCLLSLFAIILLPRQFHISVVENTSPRHVPKAMWVFPLYLLLINVFVLPIALAGKMTFGAAIDPDTFVISLPLSQGAGWLALAAFIGGFSAATSMVVVEATALSIMFSNHIVVPMLIKTRRFGGETSLVDGASRLLDIRRVSILLMLFLAYLYQKTVGNTYDLVSVGLISFTAVAQLAPAFIGGMYWKRATNQGAVAGLIVGFVLWAYCLPLPSMAKAGLLPGSFVENGLFGLSFLKPYALFGLSDLDPITHAAFWSLLFNTWLYAIVSINTKPSTLNLTQADLFVNIHKYIGGQEADVLKREAKVDELRRLLNRFLGEARTIGIFNEYQAMSGTSLSGQQVAQADLVNFAETHLAGAIGAASARLVMDSVAKEENITMDEVMRILEQTREAVEHGRLMEAKNTELKTLTLQLTAANEQLKNLDRLKADFITTVTHELRTPVTSIKSLSKIILDYSDELDAVRKQEYLQILVTESDRISRLINQVLDIEKIETNEAPLQIEHLDLSELVWHTATGISQLAAERGAQLHLSGTESPLPVMADRDRLVQVIVNLLSNAIKFCDTENGRVEVQVGRRGRMVVLTVRDNGAGIPPAMQRMIFDKFTQLHSPAKGKPQGTGLGLYITKTIVEKHGGSIRVESEPGKGAAFEVLLPLESAV